MSSTTPNMLLVIPDVGTTVGPDWATELNTALERVDAHDHSEDSGVKITPAGMNINTDLSFASHDIIDLNALVLDDLDSDVATATSVYVKGGELFYIDDSSNTVQITVNGAVNAGTGSIGGMSGTDASVSYSLANQQFSFLYNASKPAKLLSGDIELYPFDGSTEFSDFITLKTNVAQASQYDWTFPLAVPSKTSPLVWSGAGVVDDIELNNGQFLIGSTAGAVAAGAITGVANRVTVTNGANTIALDLPQDIATTSSPTFATQTLTDLVIGSGAVGTPAIRFTGDTNTGLYRVGADSVALVSGGTARVTTTTSGATIAGTLGVSGAVTGATVASTGALTALTLNTDGGGAFKVTHYSGAIAESDPSETLTPGGSIIGAMGWTEYDGGGAGDYRPMTFENGGDNGCSFGMVSATSTTVNVQPGLGTNSYRVVVFHT